jgi:hypothetical protein
MRTQRPDVDLFTTLLADPDADIDTLDQLYLHVIAADLALIAHDGFERTGRGAVVLGSYGVNIYTGSHESVPVSYLPHAQVSAMGAGRQASEIDQEIRDYAPEREFVVCINRAPRPNVYRMRQSSARSPLRPQAPNSQLAEELVSWRRWRSAWQLRDIDYVNIL